MEKLFIQGSTENITLLQLFDRFLRVKECLNLSSYTIEYYKRCFKMFSKFYDVSLPCQTVTRDVIQDYIMYLRNDTANNDISINTNLRGMRTIFYYAMELGYIKSFKISMIRAEKKIKETYTEQELNMLLKKPDIKKCSFSEYRNWVISNYLLGTGNRLETLANVKIGDVNFQDNEIVLKHNKNRKQHIIPLSKELGKTLKEYLVYRKGEAEDYLFCSCYGNQMNKRTIQSQMKSYHNSRGILKSSIHVYRHTFAKNWILAGGDIFRLQKILGHSTIEMEKEYINLFSDELKIDFSSFNPLDNLVRRQGKQSGDKIQLKK